MCPLPPAFLAQDCSCLATWAQTSPWEPRGPRLWDMAASFLFMGSLSGNAEPMSQRHTDIGRKIRQWHDLSHSSTSTARTHRAHIKKRHRQVHPLPPLQMEEREILWCRHTALFRFSSTHTYSWIPWALAQPLCPSITSSWILAPLSALWAHTPVPQAQNVLKSPWMYQKGHPGPKDPTARWLVPFRVW